MRYYHILALGLCTLFSSCKMYEEMPSCDNYPSTAISQETKALRQLLRSSKHGWMLTLVPGTGQYGGLNLSLQYTTTPTLNGDFLWPMMGTSTSRSCE